MSRIPVLSSFWNYLTAPKLPRTAISISETELALVTLGRTRRGFEPQHLAVERLEAGLIRASATEPNISDIDALVRHAERLQSGVKRLRRIAAALPEGSVRSLVLSFDGIPAGRNELQQMLEWKIERSIGCSPRDMRLSYRRLSTSKDQAHFLATVVHRQVIEQYEEFFRRMGWQAGLILPAHLAEAQWLLRAGEAEDQVLLSLNDRGFVAVITRGEEPILIREVFCQPHEREDEFHRIMIYYRDRMTSPGSPASIRRALVLGTPEEQQRFRQTLVEALESPVAILEPTHLGIRAEAGAAFPTYAAAAGLSTLGWAR